MKIKKHLKSLTLVGTIVFCALSYPTFAEESSYTITDHNDKLEIVIASQEPLSVEFEIIHEPGFNLDLLKSNALITTTEETNKVSLSVNNYIAKDDNTLIVTVPISGIDIDNEVSVTLNTEYRGNKQSTTKTALIKEEDFTPSLVSYVQEDINIYKDVTITFNWAVTNLTSEQLQKLKIDAQLGTYRLTTSVKGNSIVASMPAVRMSTEDLASINNNGKTFELKLSVGTGNTELLSLEEDVYIYNKKELLSFDFSKHYLELAQGTVNTISIKKSPTDFNCKVSYNSSDISVAEVNNKGVIQAVGTGTTTIIATCGNKTTKAVVKVHNDPVSIKFDTSTKFVEVGKQKLIGLNVAPENADIDYSSLSLTSSDFIIAAIDKNTGMITAYNEGEVEIGYTFNYQEYKETYQIVPAVKEIETSLEDWFRMQVGDTIDFTLKTLPCDITNYTSIDITSSDENLVAINGHTLTTTKAGLVRIFFTYDDVQTYVDIEIIESDDKLSDFSLNSSQATLGVGYVFNLRNVFISKGILYEDVSFSCDDTDIVKVDSNGIVTALSKGEALIKITSKTTTQYFKLKIKWFCFMWNIEKTAQVKMPFFEKTGISFQHKNIKKAFN